MMSELLELIEPGELVHGAQVRQKLNALITNQQRIIEELRAQRDASEQVVPLAQRFRASLEGDDYWTARPWWDAEPVSLVQSGFRWTLSSVGSDTYYLEAAGGGDPGLAFDPFWAGAMQEDGAELTEGSLIAVGGLQAGEWAAGDADSLGFATLYAHLSDDANPDAKPDDWVTAQQGGPITNILKAPWMRAQLTSWYAPGDELFGVMVAGAVVPTDPAPAIQWHELGPAGPVVPVSVSKVAGVAGGTTADCTFEYDAFKLNGGQQLAASAKPQRARWTGTTYYYGGQDAGHGAYGLLLYRGLAGLPLLLCVEGEIQYNDVC